MVEQIVAHLRIGDLFAKPSAAVELELADSEQRMCSAAWLAAVAALDSERSVTAGRKLDLAGKFVKVA